MSRALLLVVATMFVSRTLAQEVRCDQNPIGPTFDEAKFNKLVETWHGAFGGGGGSLGQPDGFHVTHQAVCCDGWCLAASNSAGSGRSWNDDDFTGAADRLREDGGGHSQCETQLCSGIGLDIYCNLEFLNSEYQTTDATCDGEYHGVVEAFGDTCAGAPGYNGPEC
ncbi:predicted protein [Aspergillus nidulans FGSC A4]|uniref:Uncharacterized protein n=1 Tax=Emericella nidulans (strain FGSC A4 / ATCC 38163 / CBS 112.46 / NRRL 194 / M139) TaxID=227321 RepID=Q5AWC1_EMENI|nr:hypothetical protein [Aspergillus nidulans FGSC A4]EAA61780.1 predicted protein [Aspergillus nidulans FGSC A4]CBF78437.1 TPA: conserved hypothetical protein [Aspergillus nidulans FGSC A4]|eukprot:XP_680678.1 predicted protein [Aspergillus nidulans FGSC A4]